MTRELIDPLFCNPEADKKVIKAKVEVISSLVAATEKPPLSSASKQPMQLVKGSFQGKEFSMWVDLGARTCIPVKED
jgi:hypothetical protein